MYVTVIGGFWANQLFLNSSIQWGHLEIATVPGRTHSGSAIIGAHGPYPPIQMTSKFQWIGLRENLQENPIFNGKIYGFL